MIGVTMSQREQFMEQQQETCRLARTPGSLFLMPKNGICWHCHHDVIKKELERGNDGSILVTGCPCCSRSFSD